MKILGTGLDGLVGSRIVELLKEKHEFENISLETGFDVTNKEQVRKLIHNSPADVVLHLAAYTNVKAAEAEKGEAEESLSWKVNVTGTDYVAKACEETGKFLIYTSTDLVFDGENISKGGYKEEDMPHPLSWYATTKYEGELRVKAIKTPCVIMRLAYPYRAHFVKPDFVRFFIEQFKNNKSLTVLTDRIITPTFIDDLAKAIDVFVRQKPTGIYHTVGSQAISIYEAAKLITDVFGLDQSLVQSTTREEFLVGRAPEPENSALDNTKIKDLGVSFCTFKEGLDLIKEQIELQ